MLGDKSLRPIADDVTHALIRPQQVVSLTGNVLTGAIEKALFDVNHNIIQDNAAWIGSPAAGMWLTLHILPQWSYGLELMIVPIWVDVLLKYAE